MINLDFIDDATRAYIKSYDTALSVVKNPSMAMQIAQSIIISYMIAFKPETAERPSAADTLLAAIMHNAGAAMVKHGKEPKKEEDPDE